MSVSAARRANFMTVNNNVLTSKTWDKADGIKQPQHTVFAKRNVVNGYEYDPMVPAEDRYAQGPYEFPR